MTPALRRRMLIGIAVIAALAIVCAMALRYATQTLKSRIESARGPVSEVAAIASRGSRAAWATRREARGRP